MENAKRAGGQPFGYIAPCNVSRRKTSSVFLFPQISRAEGLAEVNKRALWGGSGGG